MNWNTHMLYGGVYIVQCTCIYEINTAVQMLNNIESNTTWRIMMNCHMEHKYIWNKIAWDS